MDNKLSGRQHFFKVMRLGYDTKLPLPLAFCKTLNGEYSEVATLTSCKGTWEVEVDKCGNELICFAKGWDNFVHEHDLKVGEFVVFEHSGSMHFTASMFDSTACEKELSVNTANNREGALGGDGITDESNTKHIKREEPSEPSTSDGYQDRPQFTVTLTQNSILHNCLYIPQAFGKAHGLDTKKSVTLRDHSGKEWHVSIRCYSRRRATMTKGWSIFRRSQNMKIGDVCTFQLNPMAGDGDTVSMDVRVSPRQPERRTRQINRRCQNLM